MLEGFCLISGRGRIDSIICGERWRQMTEEEKEPNYEHAKEGTNAIRSQPKKSWKEASWIIRNLESNVCT